MSRRSRHVRRPQLHATLPPAAPAATSGAVAAAVSMPLAEAPGDGAHAPESLPPPPARDAARPVTASQPAPTAVEASPRPAAPARAAEAPAVTATASVAVVLEPGPAGPEGEAHRLTTCTQAQLRRFIKSRPWIPMHELRRRFGIFGTDDDVTPVRVGGTTIFVGLPAAEGRMLGELLIGGDVGYELSLDPGAPIVVGVYPMRPVPRG